MKRFCLTIVAIFFSITISAGETTLTLSLDEAILLAVRDNPNVQTSRLNLVAEKFSLWIQEWQFYPHYSLQGTIGHNRITNSNEPYTTATTTNVEPTVSLLTPIGTQLTLTGTNAQTLNYNPGLTLQIIQPLMRGFGRAIVEAALYNARDTDVIAKLNIVGVLRATVTEVINSYLTVVSAEQTVEIDNETVKQAETSVKQTKLFIKAGHKAGNEIVTVKANLASTRTRLENDKNALAQARYALLAAIGLDPNSTINFSNLDINKLMQKYHMPSLVNTKTCALENDIAYQTGEIILHGQKKRDLVIAEDNTRWQLNLTANIGTGNGSGGGQNSGAASLWNGANQAQNVGLILQVPIDDQLAKQGVLNAKLAIQEAELALRKDKWNKETNAINGWNNVLSAERALRFAEDAETLQKKTYDINYQKYLHGLIDSLELQTALMSLVQAKQASLNARISYLRALVNLDLLIGHTLTTWKIEVRC